MVCIGMKPNGVDEEQVKLKAFPFYLKGAAKTWLFSRQQRHGFSPFSQVQLELGMA
jgi:hypothetical protein